MFEYSLQDMKSYLLHLYLVLGLLGVFTMLKGQTQIQGKVVDKKGQALPGVSISIKDSYDGSTTDSLGRFQFISSEKGERLIQVTMVGYVSIQQKINLQGNTLKLDFILKDIFNELKAVTVTAGSFSAGDSKRASLLSPIDVATTAGSNADITAALKTLPGTQQIGEQEGLFVRGGAGYETKQFIDGTLVNNPYNASVPDIAQRGRFSPFLFKGTVFSTGGYSALYGQALSSVLLLQSIDLPEKTEFDATISPLVWGFGTQQLARDKNSSFGMSYNYTNVGLYFDLVKQTPDYFKIPQFHSGDANFRIKLKDGGIIKYYTTFNYSNLGLRRPDVDTLYFKDAFALSNRNWYNNLSLREYLPKAWKLDLGIGYSTNTDIINQSVQNANNQNLQFNYSEFWMLVKNFAITNRQDLSQGKVVLDKLIGNSSIRFGGEFQHGYNSVVINDTLHKFIDNYSAGFVETDLYATNNLTAKLGIRFENSSVLRKSDIAPRISLAFKTGKDAQVSAAYGIFYQRPENIQIFYTSNLGFTQATHYLINYQKLNKYYTLRIEAFYKQYNELVKTIPINYNYFNYDNSGKGYAKGIELFWRDKKSFKNFDYWLSYSYLDTKREYLNYTQELQPNFAARHTGSLVVKRFFTELKSGINLTYSYATGRPYYNFLNQNGNFILNDQGITRDFHSLNMSAEYLPSLGKKNAKSFIVLFASCTNILGYHAVYGYNYPFSGNPGMKQAIEPPANRFFFIGCFLSFGVDRSQDAINNNL